MKTWCSALLLVLVAVANVAGQFPGKKQPAKSDPTPKQKAVFAKGKERDDTAPKQKETADPRAKPTGKQGAKEPPAGAVQQQQNLARLKSDLQAIYKNSNVTPAQRQAVANDLRRILASATQPSSQSVNALANDLCNAVADGALDPAECMKLADDVAEVLASANISQQDAQQLMRDVQTLLRASNVTQADAQRILNDVQAIIRTAQSNSQNRGRKN